MPCWTPHELGERFDLIDVIDEPNSEPAIRDGFFHQSSADVIGARVQQWALPCGPSDPRNLNVVDRPMQH